MSEKKFIIKYKDVIIMKIFGFNIEKRSDETSGLTNEETSSADGFALSFLQNTYNTYRSNTLSAVFSAVELISNSIAQLPIHIKDISGNIIEHPMSDVFNNNLISKFMLMKQLVSDMLINGNGIAYIERDKQTSRPLGLVYCPKGTYTITYNDTTRNLYYQIPTCSSSIIPPSDIIHIYKNSVNGVEGKGLYYYAGRTIDAANATENSAKGYFESGCAINGILKSSKHLSKKQQKDILQAWNTAHVNSTSNNIAVMPVDLDYIALSSNASESQLLQTRLYNVTEVARFFNINPVLLGDLTHSSYSTIEAAQLEFLVHTLAPYIELIQDELNRKLCKGSEVYIDIDEDHMLKADKSSTATYLKTLTSAGIYSINEARHQLGLQPIEGGDKHIIPYTDINSNTIEETDEDKNTDLENND